MARFLLAPHGQGSDGRRRRRSSTMAGRQVNTIVNSGTRSRVWAQSALAAILVVGMVAGCAGSATPSGRLPDPWVGELPLEPGAASSLIASVTPHPIFSLLATPLPECAADVE